MVRGERMTNRIILSMALMLVAGSMTHAQTWNPVSAPEGPLTVIYDPADGNVSVTVDSVQLSTFELQGTDFFSGSAMNLGGIFDVASSDKLFKLDPAGFGPIDFGPAMVTGLSATDWESNIGVNGSLLSGGVLPTPISLQIVPEPTSIVLTGLISAIGLIRIRRRR